MLEHFCELVIFILKIIIRVYLYPNRMPEHLSREPSSPIWEPLSLGALDPTTGA